MMVSSESPSDLDALSKKIDAALTFPNQREVVDAATQKRNSEINEFRKCLEEMRRVFIEEICENPDKFFYVNKFLSSCFPDSKYLKKSKILEDRELLQAIFYSEIFENEWHYAIYRDQYQGQMVWVEMRFTEEVDPFDSDVALISGDEIIYETNRATVESIRFTFMEYWEFFKKEVRENLITSQVMVSSESQNDLDALSQKIDAALTLPTECLVVDGATEKSSCKFNSCKEFLEYLEETRKAFLKERSKNPNKFQYDNKFIYTDIGPPVRVLKSKILEDRDLLRAILYSKIFEDKHEYARNRDKYQGQMVWVEMDLSFLYGLANYGAALISEDKIIYESDRRTIEVTRATVESYWKFCKEELKQHLLESLSVPASIPDSSKCGADLKSSFDAAISSEASTTEHQEMATMTEEMKKILLDELNSLHLDPRLQRQFEFDLKLLVDKDVYYWRDRLDALRCFSNSAPVGSARSQELVQLRQKVAKLEKMTASLRDEIDSASNLSEKLSKLEKRVSQIESPRSTWSDSLWGMDAGFVAECWNPSDDEMSINDPMFLKYEEVFPPLPEKKVWRKGQKRN